MRWRILLYGGWLLIAAGCLEAIFFILPHGGVVRAPIFIAVYLLLSQLWPRLLRRRIRVSVQQAWSVDAPPDRVRALMSSAEVSSLRSGYHEFDIPPSAGLPLLRVVTRIASGGGSSRLGCSAYELTEVSAAGQPDGTLIMHNTGLPKAKAVARIIQVTPDGSATRVIITVRRSWSRPGPCPVHRLGGQCAVASLASHPRQGSE